MIISDPPRWEVVPHPTFDGIPILIGDRILTSPNGLGQQHWYQVHTIRCHPSGSIWIYPADPRTDHPQSWNEILYPSRPVEGAGRWVVAHEPRVTDFTVVRAGQEFRT